MSDRHDSQELPEYDNPEHYLTLIDDDLKLVVDHEQYVRVSAEKDIWQPVRSVSLAKLKLLAVRCLGAKLEQSQVLPPKPLRRRPKFDG